MADENTPDNTAAAAQPQISAKVLAQFVRDLSFENILAQKGTKGDVQPEIQVQVNLDARKRGAENQFEVITKLKITSKTKDGGEPLFVFELEYSGVFQIDGVPEDQISLLCAQLLRPLASHGGDDGLRAIGGGAA